MDQSDHDLLRGYARDGSQAAFATLVDRHLDLVYSAARRQVRSPQLAEEVAQSVFIDLARNAAKMNPETPLAAWLHLVTRRTAIDAIRRESRRAARESQAACPEPVEWATFDPMKTDATHWSAVEPLLDEAVQSLDTSDRAAILLRYFENKSLREVGATLGTSDDAAQKRVSRAVEQLRTFFLRRGVTVTAAGLATDLSAHALQIAPAGLGAAISSTAVVTAAGTTAALETSRLLVMTTLQKSVAGLVVALAVGAALFEAQTLFAQRSELRASAQAVSALAAQLNHARETGDATARQLEEVSRRLTALRATSAIQPKPDAAIESEMRAWLQRVSRLHQLAARSPEKTLPEIRLLNEDEWFKIGQDPNLPEDVALRTLSGLGKATLTFAFSTACAAYVKAHDGRLPDQVNELKPYLTDVGQVRASEADDAVFARYAMRYTGPLEEVPVEARNGVIVEITAPDEERDQRMISGPMGGGLRNFKDLTPDTKAALWAFAKAKPGAAPASAAELLPYFKPPLSPAREARFLQNPGPLAPR